MRRQDLASPLQGQLIIPFPEAPSLTSYMAMLAVDPAVGYSSFENIVLLPAWSSI